MKKSIVMVIFLVALISQFNIYGAAEDESIKIGVYPNPPLLFEGETGEAEGLFIDLLNEYATKNELIIEYSFGTLDENFKRLQNGDIDWMPGIAYSTERDALYYFNDEVLFINWGQIYGANGTNVRSMEDLKGMKIGVQKADIHYKGAFGIYNTMEQFSFDAEYIEYDSKDEIFIALSEKNIDVGVVNRIFGMLNESKHSVIKTPIQLNPIRMHLISMDDSFSDLFQEFDKYLDELKDNKDSLYYKGIEKWFGNDISTSVPEWLTQVMIGSGIVILILVIAVLFTRFEIQRKTKEVKDLNQNLETKVLERTILIEKQQNELIESSKMAALGQLVAGVAHEINTPIGVGVTIGSHMKENTKDVISLLDQQKLTKNGFAEYVDNMESGMEILVSSLQRAGQLISNFKQVAVDSHDIEIDTINVRSYTEMIIKGLKTQSKYKDIQFDIHCDEALLINTFPGSFSQVISNLVMNSLQHGFVNSDTGKIEMVFERNKDKVKLTYKDDGKGIPKDIVSKIFDPFFTTSRGEGGSGLGLHIVYNVVRNKLMGKIEYIDGINTGAGFIVTFGNLGGEQSD